MLYLCFLVSFRPVCLLVASRRYVYHRNVSMATAVASQGFYVYLYRLMYIKRTVPYLQALSPYGTMTVATESTSGKVR
jgi:hypothetical protein